MSRASQWTLSLLVTGGEPIELDSNASNEEALPETELPEERVCDGSEVLMKAVHEYSLQTGHEFVKRRCKYVQTKKRLSLCRFIIQCAKAGKYDGRNRQIDVKFTRTKKTGCYLNFDCSAVDRSEPLVSQYKLSRHGHPLTHLGSVTWRAEALSTSSGNCSSNWGPLGRWRDGKYAR